MDRLRRFTSRGFIFLSLLLTLSVSHANTNFQVDSYTVYSNASNTEIYLEAKERFLLIAGDISVPLLITDGPNLRLTASNGGYTIDEISSIPSGLSPASDLDIFTGDFDGDNKRDLLLAPNINDSDSSHGAGVFVFGTSSSVPTRVESYTHIQGIALVDAAISVDDIDNDGLDELVVTGTNGIYQVANYSGGFNTDRQLKSGTLVGSTATEFEVTYGGAASYSVPLSLPSGAAGLKPSLSLNYNSQLGNGLMGLGWQLQTGLGIIHECYKQNTNQLINCLNGEELVSIGGDYYRTEIDSGILVEAVNNTTFKLHYENGNVKTLTRHLSSPNLYLEDNHTQRGGASYSVNWSVDNTDREPLVNSISYQGNEVEFIYEDRSDVRYAYKHGAVTNRTQRLHSIVAKADGQVFRQYEIYYTQDDVSGLSQLTHIQECTVTGECLKPLAFNWSDSGSIGFGPEQHISHYYRGIWNKNNLGKDEFQEYPSVRGLKSRSVADIDGDGRDDMITNARYKQNDSRDNYRLRVEFADGNVLNVESGITLSGKPSTVHIDLISVTDLNNDGKSEIYYYRKGRGTYIYHLDSTGTPVKQPLDLGKEVSFVDLNGDELLDAIYLSSSDEGQKYRLNQGDFSFGSLIDLSVDFESSLVDLNGDGLFEVYNKLSLGNGHFASIASNALLDDTFLFIDLNADGLADSFSCGNHNTLSNCSALLSNGDGSFSQNNSFQLSQINHYHTVADVNGDGIQDLVYRTNSSDDTKVRYGLSRRSYINTFTDSYGNQHTVDYSKLTDASVYTRDSYSAGISFSDTRPYNQPLTVVKSITTPDDQVFYKYAGARMHNGEHGYLGFKSITSVLAKTDASGNDQSLVTTSYLNQQYPFVGKLQSVKKKVYPGLASTVATEISYDYHNNSEHLVAMRNGVPVGVGPSSTIPTNYASKGGQATGTNFTGQMNSYFDWQSITLTGGIHKTYLKEKLVEHLQLSDDALIKTEIMQANWSASSSGHYARLLSSTDSVFDSAGQEQQRQVTTLSYEHQDSYGLPDAFLVNTSTLDTTLYNNGNLQDSHQLQMEYDYYSSGLIQYEWLNRNDSKGIRTAYQYDSYGNAIQTTLTAVNASTARSEMARGTSRSYSSQGKYLHTETNAKNQTTTYTNYSVHGLPQYTADAKGLVTQITYDALGRVDSTIDYLGNRHLTYRGFCSATSCTNGAYTWERNIPAGGAESYQFWDKEGQLVKTASQSFESGDWLVQGWQYDTYGRRIKESVPALQSLNASIAFTTNGGYNHHLYTYDELNRITRQQLPGDNRVVVKDYASELAIVTTDPAQRITTTYTNVLGQLTRKTQPGGGDVNFVYDAQGNVTHQSYPQLDAAGQIIFGQYHQVINTYDTYGNHLSTDDPNTGQWTYVYNAYGELIEQTDARGEKTHFTYDVLGRLLTQRDSQSYSVWEYDQEEAGLLDQVVQYDITLLTASAQNSLTPTNVATTSGVQLAYQQQLDYDDASKQPSLAQTTQRNRSGSLESASTTMSYDIYGRLSQQTLPAAYVNQGSLSAPRLSYQYNSYGYLSQIRDQDSNQVYQQIDAIDAFSNITSQTLGGNISVYQAFDANTAWASTLQASNANGLIIDQSYTNYNALGLMGQRDDAAYYNAGADFQTWTDTFQYNDALQQQLTQASIQYHQDINGIALSENWTHQYQYDALGNMRSKSISLNNQTAFNGAMDYHYVNGQPHRLSSVSGPLNRSYSYDSNGNITADSVKNLSYNSWNKLAQVTRGNDSTRFEYGPDRYRYLRVDTSASTTTETFYVDNYERVSTTENGQTTIQHKYRIAGVALVIQTETVNTEVTYGLISDHQGSLLALTNSTGELTQRFRYTPFGEQIDVSQGITGSQSLTTRGYTSHEHIEGMDIIHMNGRIYDSAINRMMQADPIIQAPTFILSYNRYAYVWNDPLNGIDASGYERTGNGDGRTFDQARADRINRFSRSSLRVSSGRYNMGRETGVRQAQRAFRYAKDNSIYGRNGWNLTSGNRLELAAFQASYMDRSTEYGQHIARMLNAADHVDVAEAFLKVNEWDAPLHSDNGMHAIRMTLMFQPNAFHNIAVLFDVNRSALPPRVTNFMTQYRLVNVPKKASGPDFVVTKDGTAVPVSQSQMRKGFDDAGYPSSTSKITDEAAVTHTIQTPKGPIDVRTMEGGANHSRRAVLSTPGQPRSPRTPSGRTPQGTKQERRAASHFEQSP